MLHASTGPLPMRTVTPVFRPVENRSATPYCRIARSCDCGHFPNQLRGNHFCRSSRNATETTNERYVAHKAANVRRQVGQTFPSATYKTLLAADRNVCPTARRKNRYRCHSSSRCARAVGGTRFGAGRRENVGNRQVTQQPIGLTAGRHLHDALRHERLHQRRHRLRAARAVRPTGDCGRRLRSCPARPSRRGRGAADRWRRTRSTSPTPDRRCDRRAEAARRPGRAPSDRRRRPTSERPIVPRSAASTPQHSSRRPRRKRADGSSRWPMPLRRCGK